MLDCLRQIPSDSFIQGQSIIRLTVGVHQNPRSEIFIEIIAVSFIFTSENLSITSAVGGGGIFSGEGTVVITAEFIDGVNDVTSIVSKF